MSKTAGRKREQEKGRKDKLPFVNLPRRVVTSEEWASTSSSAIRLLVELASQYYGPNNGDLAAPWSRMRSRGWKSQDTLAKAKRELLERGWITCTRQGLLMRVPTLYALSWQPINSCGGKLDVCATQVPSNSWQKSVSDTPGGVSRYAERSQVAIV